MSDNAVLAALIRLEEGQVRLEEGQVRLEEGQARLVEGQVRQDQRYVQLKQEVTELRVGIMARLDEHANKLTAIGDDLTVNMAAVGYRV